MSKNTKTALVILGGVIFLCIVCLIIGYFGLRTAGTNLLDRMVIDDPEEVDIKARQIIDYDLPPGYEEQSIVDMFFGKMLMIEGNTGTTAGNGSGIFIMIFEMTANFDMDREEMRLRIESEMQTRMRSEGWVLKLVEEKPTVIRDQKTTLLVYEGTDEFGNQLKQIVTTFDGKNGLIMLMMAGREDAWNNFDIDAFIMSIR